MPIHVFVTVGTTSFDDLIESVCSEPFLIAMAETLAAAPSTTTAMARGDSPHPSSAVVVARLTIQHGRGRPPSEFLPPSFLFADDGFDDGNADNDDVDDGRCRARLRIPVAVRSDDGAETTGFAEVTASWYRFKPSLASDLSRAGVVLCHAGAGTLMDALTAPPPPPPDPLPARDPVFFRRRKIHAVVNASLMDDHQRELADELGRRGHVTVSSNPSAEWMGAGEEGGAASFWRRIAEFQPRPFRGGAGGGGVGRIVDDLMGFAKG